MTVRGPRLALNMALLTVLAQWDIFHALLDPRPRPRLEPEVVDPRPLEEQTRVMEADLRARFLVAGDRILLPDTPPVSVGDNCLWQGVYAGMAALRYSMKPTRENRRLAERALEGLELLAGRGRPIARSILPLQLQTEPPGRWFYRDDEWQWKEDASVDSAAGWIFGVTMALEHLPSRRERAAELLYRFSHALVENGFLLRNSNGTPTRFPSLGGELPGSPTGALVALTALEGARRYREHAALERARRDLLRDGQQLWGAYASGPVLWRNVTTNHNIGFLALAAALLVETEPERRRIYASGMVRLARLTWGHGNSFWLYLTRWATTRLGPQAPEAQAPAVGAWLAEKEIQFRAARVAMLEWRYPFNKTKRHTINSLRPNLRWVRWALGPAVLRSPVPVWQRPATDFLWQRSPYQLDDWRGYRWRPDRVYPGEPQRFAPLDFLIAYYLGKRVGAL